MTTTKTNTKVNTKGTIKFKFTTRLIALLLSIITAFSVVTVPAGSAYATDINTTSVLTGMTTSCVSTAIGLATAGNPVTAILGAGLSSVFGSVFGGLFKNKDTTATDTLENTKQILSEVKGLSNTVQANHVEEMNVLSNIQTSLKDVQEAIDGVQESVDGVQDSADYLEYLTKMQGFNSSYNNMSNISTVDYKLIDSFVPTPKTALDDENKIIDEDTYAAYSELLEKTGYKSSTKIEEQFEDMRKYIVDSGTLDIIIAEYARELRGQTPTSFDNVTDFREIETTLQQIEADVVIFYTLNLTLIQMTYQCKDYDRNNGEDVYTAYPTKSFVSQITSLGNEMQTIHDTFINAYNSIEKYITATVTVDGVTKSFTFTPLAWTEFAAAAKNGNVTEFKLTKDWTAPSAEVGFAMTKSYKSKGYEGFNSDGTLILTVKNSATVDLSEYILDGSKMTQTDNKYFINVYPESTGSNIYFGFREAKRQCVYPETANVGYAYYVYSGIYMKNRTITAEMIDTGDECIDIFTTNYYLTKTTDYDF